MKIIIRSDESFFLHTAVEPLLRLAEGRPAPSQEESELSQEEALRRFETVSEAVERYRPFLSAEAWQREIDALKKLLACFQIPEKDQPSAEFYVLPLTIPAGLPLALLPLLEGWEVKEEIQNPSSQFSPVAMIWLKEIGAKPVTSLNGNISRVEMGDGVAVLSVKAEETGGRKDSLPIVHEFRKHDVEHIDTGMMLMQANVDDCSPEWMAHAMERLFEAGANDVHFIPVTMKKSRPGILVQVLCYQSKVEELTTILFQETSTFGVRYFPAACHRLARQFLTVKTTWGGVPVKIGIHRGKRVQCSPEYAVCARLAKEAGVSVKEVHQEALMLAMKQV
ncbi:LarC family nickel insertion protein [Brevibacillus ruminantium]|uniref:LarC family nickel insertion protein n=1 Tax=Brevibacillus ruminantium TaxID=2950604 RepID=A0ABY4WN30_9BACL|nr:nickel insertion protein [Brevibacillus ruminantium]USG66799.1 LarC family nickel insertion protein [Brevibacillus ruminantium]